jgi:hypothetical protein
MGPNLIRILRNFWENLQVVPRQSGFYGHPIPSRRGVTQGDPLSPTIFNIVIDAIVRELFSYPYFDSLKVLFYANFTMTLGHFPIAMDVSFLSYLLSVYTISRMSHSIHRPDVRVPVETLKGPGTSRKCPFKTSCSTI